MAGDYQIPFHPVTGEMMDYEHPVWAYLHPVDDYILEKGVHYDWSRDKGFHNFVDDAVRDFFTNNKRPHQINIGPVWKDNYVFPATMRIDNMQRGRSAARFVLVRAGDQRRFIMFMKDMLEMLQASVVRHGEVSGEWTFVKRGANYGVQLVRTYDRSGG